MARRPVDLEGVARTRGQEDGDRLAGGDLVVDLEVRQRREQVTPKSTRVQPDSDDLAEAIDVARLEQRPPGLGGQEIVEVQELIVPPEEGVSIRVADDVAELAQPMRFPAWRSPNPRPSQPG